MTASPPPAEASFEAQAAEVASRLRTEVAAVFAALPGRVSGGTELDRELKLGNTVSWRLYSFATAANPVAALELLPGRATIERLAKAAAGKGVSPAMLDRVRDAYARYETFMDEHAGDRATLVSLVGGIASEGGAGHLSRRRTAVRINSDLWGVQAQTTLMCSILHENADKSDIDVMIVSGFARLHALRKNVPLRVMVRSGIYDTRESTSEGGKPFVRPGETHLLDEFSTSPFPKLEVTPAAAGMREASLRFESVGKASAIDMFTLASVRNAYKGVPQPWHGTTKGVSVPCEVLLLDFLVPRGWTNPATLRASTHGNPAMFETLIQRVPDFEMPVAEQATHLGAAIGAMETPDVPRYPEMIRTVLTDAGWIGTTFDIYRVRVRYPIMHTLIHMRADTVKA